jgi:hypothetical protein
MRPVTGPGGAFMNAIFVGVAQQSRRLARPLPGHTSRPQSFVQ